MRKVQIRNMLKKKEIIYREILARVFEEKQTVFTQLSLSKKFGVSLSTVSNALKPIERIGAIEKHPRSFVVIDSRKFLLFWASVRNIRKDIIYETRSDLPVMKIEGSMPSGVAFTAFSGYRLLYHDAPADYGEVYVYADEETLREIKERFPEKKGPPNLIVLAKDAFMASDKVSLAQLYADFWNTKEWYAKEYLDALDRRLFR
jgi:DNA-binding transcriptional MocR family regulator